ncbi:S-layer homology domain-containing protein [Paenibacillus sp. GCM10028914]|uniref:S-layer homology domain-containing protein n=1 Tax=Paenibacillus sp. GCM10028914 TaxID=3273416 RepID=UPI0036180278
MSNKSYHSNPIKENNQVLIQGGEKKVMKKILSVALSTAMAFSMFASVAFGDDAKLTTAEKFNVLKDAKILTGYQDGSMGLEKDLTRAEFATVVSKLMGLKPIEGQLSFKDKGYTAKNWSVKYIEAVYAAGLMEGKNTTKKIFDYNGKITVQEMAAVLVRATKLEVPTETDNDASAWAKGYVQAAINAGIIEKGAAPKANATRSQMTETAYAIWLSEQQPAVVSYEVKEDGKVVEFKLANGDVVPVTPETPLKANVETVVTFKHANYDYSEKVTWVVTAATKVQGVSASNYKQVVVAFDGDVDKATATNPSNYSISGLSFSAAALSEDAKTVTLTIAQDSGKLDRQKEYTINLKGVRNADRTKTFSDAVKFSPVDTTLPEVKEVVGLGTKAFKVVFSEPVQQSSVVSTSNFMVDGKAVSGYVTYQYPNIAIISTDLAVGSHELTVRNVKDYADFTILSASSNFTVAEDKTAPEVVGATTNDLTRVEIEFNETIKSVSKVYQTSSSKTATYTISDNKVIATFSDPNKLSLAETTIYLEGVTDYSNNSANREVKVTPVLDTERPTVVGVEADVDKGNHEFTVEFSEAVLLGDITNPANYVLKDKDGKVVTGKGFTTKGNPVKAPEFVTGSQNKKVKITSIGQLASGVYTLEISNIRDVAAIGNTMLPYSTTIDLADIEKPKVLSTSYYEVTTPGNSSTFTGLDIIVHYSKPMAFDGVGNVLEANKYNYASTANAATYLPLPVNSSVSAINAETVRISLPAKEGGYITTNDDGVKQAISLRVVNVADANGNYISNNVVTTAVNEKGQQYVDLKTVKATDNNTIVAEFEGPLSYVQASDFIVTAGESTYGVVVVSNNNGVVTFDLAGDNKLAPEVGDNVTLSVKGGNHTVQTVNNNGLKARGSKDITDAISPTYVEKSVAFKNGEDNTTVATLTFDEALVVFNNPTAFVVHVDGEPVDVTKVERNSGDNKKVEITFKAATVAGKTVEIYSSSNFASAKFVTDTAGNAANAVAIN